MVDNDDDESDTIYTVSMAKTNITDACDSNHETKTQFGGVENTSSQGTSTEEHGMWFAVMLFFSDTGTEYTPFGKPYNTYEECVASIDPRAHSTVTDIQCFEKDILITLLKHSK